MFYQGKAILMGAVFFSLGLFLQAGHAAQQCVGGYAEQFKVRGQVAYPMSFNLDDLQQMDLQSLTTTVYSGSQGLVTASYRGVPLLQVLNKAVVKTSEQIKNDIIRKSVVIRATDCYETVLSVADLMPEFGGDQVLLAIEKNGELLADEGFVELVIAGDKKASRYVSNVSMIKVR